MDIHARPLNHEGAAAPCIKTYGEVPLAPCAYTPPSIEHGDPTADSSGDVRAVAAFLRLDETDRYEDPPSPRTVGGAARRMNEDVARPGARIGGVHRPEAASPHEVRGD